MVSGTGKSHLALRLIKMLSTLEGMKPILFITVKNAVLDNALQKLINMKVNSYLYLLQPTVGRSPHYKVIVLNSRP